MLGKIRWNDTHLDCVDNAILAAKALWGSTGSGEIDDIVFDNFKYHADEIIQYYISMQMHIIGRWFPTQNNQYTIFSTIVSTHLSKLKPSLMNISATVSKTPLSKVILRMGQESVSGSGSNTISKMGTKDTTNRGNNDGTSRSAGENSPITAATINSSPTSATEWDIGNPSSKSGSQYNNEFSNVYDEDTTDNEMGEYSNTKGISNNSTADEKDPLTYREILLFNAYQFNITNITQNFCKSLTEEYNTCY